MKNIPRVAFFPDSFLEVNGVAMTSKRLIGYAKRRGYPYLCIHAGKKTETATDESVRYLSLKRSPVSFPMDEDLKYDPLFQRHTNRVLRELLDFQPDVIHITGLNDVSIVGAYLAWKLQIPLVGSWHTNLHEFAARRLTRMFRFLPQKTLDSMTGFAERKIMDGAVLYYKMPKIILAPNQELILWPFFDFADARWTFGAKYAFLRQDVNRGPTKVGLAHREGWVGYLNGGVLFVKRFDYREGAVYPDLGTRYQTFSNEDMLEMETVGELVTLAPGASAELKESWGLYGNVPPVRTEADVDRLILPLLGK